MYQIIQGFVLVLFFFSSSLVFAHENEEPDKEPFAFYAPNFSSQWISDHNFVYNSDLVDFDLAEYLTNNAPHLLPYAELISHWSGYYSINPKVLLTLIEMQTGLISEGDLEKSQQKPLDGLAKSAEFNDQVKEVLSGLYSDYYAYQSNNQHRQSKTTDTVNAATYALMNLYRGELSRDQFASDVEPAKANFTDAYQQLFPNQQPTEASKTEQIPQGATPPVGFLQLPWKIGESWRFGGVHTTTGGSTGAMSSLDFFATGSGGWGSDTSTDYVVASHAGTVTVFSSCYVRITAANGWMTHYYHLDSLTVTTGEQVTANQTIGVYANNASQALCQGGSSTGPHVHWSLLDNGTYSSLSGVDLSGYIVHPGRHSYDTDPAYMWVERNGTKYYTYHSLLNDASTTPAATTLIAPSGSINDSSPTYSWNAVSNSAWYSLWVKDSSNNTTQQWYSAAQAGCGAGAGTCSISPSTQLANGTAVWSVQTWNTNGYGPWSAAITFAVNASLPPSATSLISPSGAISDSSPTFNWDAVSNSTGYYLWVNDPSGNRIKQWYTPVQAGCDSGTGTCSVTPAVILVNGAGIWWVQTWNSAGLGPWSSAMNFNVSAGLPTAATGVSPSGVITDSTPSYTWNAASNSTWYQLWVNDSTGNRISEWYTGDQAGCPGGTGSCSITPITVLNAGDGKWWVRTWNSSGYGPWNSGVEFTLN